jgi:hypothetical protein
MYLIQQIYHFGCFKHSLGKIERESGRNTALQSNQAVHLDRNVKSDRSRKVTTASKLQVFHIFEIMTNQQFLEVRRTNLFYIQPQTADNWTEL